MKKDLPTRLVDATLKLMDRSDVRHLSLREIAAEAGVSHMAPYRHFKNKEAILVRIAEQGYRLVTEATQAAIDEHPVDAKKQLLRAGHNYLQFAKTNPKHLQLMYGGIGTQILKKHPELREWVDRSRATMLRMIRNCQIEGILPRKRNTEELATLFWSLVHGISLLEINTEFIGFSDRPNPRRIIETGIASMVSGLCK